MAQKWELITAELDPQARAGDPAAIRKNLAERGEEKKTESAAWIDHKAQVPRAEAVTSGLSTRVYLPGSVLARMHDEQESIELWHNHPEVNGKRGSAVPSAEDIAVAVMPGVAALTTVDDYGRWTRIRRDRNAQYHRLVVTQWVKEVEHVAEQALAVNNPPPVDEEEQHERMEIAAEVAAGAAVAVGLIKAERLSAGALRDGKIAARLVNANEDKTLDAIKARTDLTGKGPDGLQNTGTPGRNTRRRRWKQSGPGVDPR